MLRAIVSPFAKAGRFLLRTVGIPVYRFFFRLKRSSSKVIAPTKHRILYLVSNRFAVHAIIVAVVVLASTVNLTGSQVRAETFGQNSRLYQLVSQDDSAVVDVVAAGETVERKPSSYMNDTVVDANLHLDMNYIEEDYVTPSVGSAVAAPAAQEVDQEDVPERDTVQQYAIQEGDTLSTIAQKFGLNLSSLLWANDLTLTSVLQPGETLTIPPTDGVLYTVESGDTLNAIANKYNAEGDKIMEFNKLASADDLNIGEELMLPGAEKPSSQPSRQTPSSSSVNRIFTQPGSSSSGSSSSNGSSSGNSGSTPSRASGSAAASAGSWIWPTDWRVITQYYGWRHTGIDVDGDYSTDSYAAADGVVIYSGWRSGYGITVEIDHGNGYVTRYAHHSKNYVGVGDVVSAGQAIAQTGTTGRSTGTHLHFEVIKNGSFQNPLDYVR